MGEHADDALHRAMDIEEHEERHQQAWEEGLAEEPPGNYEMGVDMACGTSRTEFTSMHLGVPMPPDPMAELAKEYHDRCDEFDASIGCPDGVPGDQFDRSKMRRNALAVLDDILERHGTVGDPDWKHRLWDAIIAEARSRRTA